MSHPVPLLRAAWVLLLLALAPQALLAATADDSDESAYVAATLGKIFAMQACSLNDEAELAAPGQWFFTTATFTGKRRPPSGLLRPIISSWAQSRELGAEVPELLFGGEFPELEFEQSGKRYWVFAGYPGGMGSEVYRASQKLTIYLQRVGCASGVPVVIMARVRLAADVPARTSVPRIRNTPMGSGARRQERTYTQGRATFTYAGRAYSLPLDVSGRHSIAPGLYSYENGVRTALLEYGESDAEYLLLRVTVAQGAQAPTLVPYLVVGGRITPPLALDGCAVNLSDPGTDSRGAVDCSAANYKLSKLEFSAGKH